MAVGAIPRACARCVVTLVSRDGYCIGCGSWLAPGAAFRGCGATGAKPEGCAATQRSARAPRRRLSRA
eukprot:8573098-Pyramimonas_sp.AAC.1